MIINICWETYLAAREPDPLIEKKRSCKHKSPWGVKAMNRVLF